MKVGRADLALELCVILQGDVLDQKIVDAILSVPDVGVPGVARDYWCKTCGQNDELEPVYHSK